MVFLGLLSSEVELADYVTIDDSVVVAGHLNDDEIIRAALSKTDEASNKDPCDELRPGLSHARKLDLAAQLSTKKQTSITDYFSK
ncbi:hypothetical protein HPB52_003095 [Rhipicephalus sanguineus]|uniref:Uncharacterized protein n=1 Tax=Rhipicephalus sanguineus TaxID=34632 RepID=A0A9D4T375_RHISA|nr:hypothetical protein HPB52_003095 [Rhipicephalus sanguineus]